MDGTCEIPHEAPSDNAIQLTKCLLIQSLPCSTTTTTPGHIRVRHTLHVCYAQAMDGNCSYLSFIAQILGAPASYCPQ